MPVRDRQDSAERAAAWMAGRVALAGDSPAMSHVRAIRVHLEALADLGDDGLIRSVVREAASLTTVRVDWAPTWFDHEAHNRRVADLHPNGWRGAAKVLDLT